MLNVDIKLAELQLRIGYNYNIIWRYRGTGAANKKSLLVICLLNKCRGILLSVCALWPILSCSSASFISALNIQDATYQTFLETSEQIQISDVDSSHLDIYQEHQDDQECPPSSRMFLMALISTNTHVSYIFEILK